MEHQIKECDSLIELLEALERDDKMEMYPQAFSRYLSLRARKFGIPLHGSFELTPLCNFDCRMCYVHLQKDAIAGDKLLTVEQWKSLIAQAVNGGMMDATLTGGECLTYYGFDDVYLYLQSLGIRPAILTNGMLLTEERVSFFREHPPKGIQITLYGENDDVYEAVTGHREFEAVMKGIERVQNAKIPLSIAITPNRYLPDGGKRLLRFVHELNIPYTVNTMLFVPREETGKTEVADLSIDEYIELLILKKELQGVCVEAISECELPLPNLVTVEKKGLLCGGGRTSFCINWRGVMFPCASLTDISAEPLKVGFMSAWKKVNSEAKVYPLPMECSDCTYRNVCPSCVVAHRQGVEIGHASPKLCERAKRIVEAGLGKCL